jgi:hypothetical protein
VCFAVLIVSVLLVYRCDSWSVLLRIQYEYNKWLVVLYRISKLDVQLSAYVMIYVHADPP